MSEEKTSLANRKSLWLSIIASILVSFLMWLLIYLSEFIRKEWQASFIVIISAILFLMAIKKYKKI